MPFLDNDGGSGGGTCGVSSTTKISRERTLTRGTGSRLWMAPEALVGKRISGELAPALDVYRCVLRVPFDKFHPRDQAQLHGDT
jgi:hypothetical protein